jgi:hypothetical protein
MHAFRPLLNRVHTYITKIHMHEYILIYIYRHTYIHTESHHLILAHRHTNIHICVFTHNMSNTNKHGKLYYHSQTVSYIHNLHTYVVGTYILAYVCVDICTHAHYILRMYVWICGYVTHTYAHAYIHTSYIYTYIYIYICIHTYTHQCIYVHMHTQLSS